MSGSPLRTADGLDIREDKSIGAEDSFGGTFLTHELGYTPASGVDFYFGSALVFEANGLQLRFIF